MMKTYLVNGIARRYPEGEAPEGAVLVGKKIEKKEVPAAKEEPEKKAVKKPANKAKKAGENK